MQLHAPLSNLLLEKYQYVLSRNLLHQSLSETKQNIVI